jgi:hypothetical protein
MCILRLMHVPAFTNWPLPLLAATFIHIRLTIQDTSKTICVPSPRKHHPASSIIYAYLDRHLAITSSHLAIISTFKDAVRKVANKIESVITSLNTRTARDHRRTKIAMWKRNRAHHKPRKKINLCRLACILHVIVYATGVEASSPQSRKLAFDTDSVPIWVNNCATACISNNLHDFEGPLTPVRGRVKGISGFTSTGLKRGTIGWKIEDDEGQVHRINLPGSYCVPDSTSRILSPQHWAQQARDNKPRPPGTWCATYDDEIVLYWNQRKYKRTIQLSPTETNTATIRSAPGYTRFTAFNSNLEGLDEEVLAYEAPLVSDEEGNNNEHQEHTPSNQEQDKQSTGFQRESPVTTDFNLDGPSTMENK